MTFELPPIPTLEDRINRATKDIVHTTDARTAHFDTDLVYAIGIIADILCRNNYLQREPLIELIDAVLQDRKASWAGEYSPLASLATFLRAVGKIEFPGGNVDVRKFFEVIEGGLSKKPKPEEVE